MYSVSQMLFNVVHWIFAIKYWVLASKLQMMAKNQNPNTKNTFYTALSYTGTFLNLICGAVYGIPYSAVSRATYSAV